MNFQVALNWLINFFSQLTLHHFFSQVFVTVKVYYAAYDFLEQGNIVFINRLVISNALLLCHD